VARLALAAPADRPAIVRAVPVFEAVYDEHFDFIWRTARRLGVPESAADDVVQDTFVVLHRRLGEYDGGTPMRRWLVGILTRVVAGHRRRYRRKDAACVPHPDESERALPSNAPAPSAEVEQSEAVHLLDALLAEIDEDKREVLVLAQLEEMTVPEIAELLGANLNTVYARLRAARRDFDAAYARHRARSEHAERADRRLP
jgi:RNA polymerase sigma-70 factor (ECF subfamily)